MLPFLGSAAFDADGDGIDELFLGGGLNQDDKLFRYSPDGFVDTGMRFQTWKARFYIFVVRNFRSLRYAMSWPIT